MIPKSPFTKQFVNVSQAYITFYVQYTIELPEAMIAIIPLIMYVAGIVVSFVLKLLTDKLGYKKRQRKFHKVLT